MITRDCTIPARSSRPRAGLRSILWFGLLALLGCEGAPAPADHAASRAPAQSSSAQAPQPSGAQAPAAQPLQASLEPERAPQPRLQLQIAPLEKPVWPQETTLPEALAQPPESFGDLRIEPGKDETVCSMRLWTESAPDGALTLHGGLLPDFVDTPRPGLNLRHDPLPDDLAGAPFVRLGRQRWIATERQVEGAVPGTLGVYLDRTFWEAPLTEHAPELWPGESSTFWLSSAGRERIVFGDGGKSRVELALELTPVAAHTDTPVPEGKRRWAIHLRARTQSADGKRQELLVEHGAPAAEHPLGPEYTVRLASVASGEPAKAAFEASGTLVTSEPIPTVHAQIALTR